MAWASKKTKRVARSTLTAETLAADEAVDNAVVVQKTVEEVLGRRLPPITLFVDNKSLCEAVESTNVPTEKRLKVDLGAHREMVEREDLVMKWIPTTRQLADVLTKQGASKTKLTEVVNTGKLF